MQHFNERTNRVYFDKVSIKSNSKIPKTKLFDLTSRFQGSSAKSFVSPTSSHRVKAQVLAFLMVEL